MNWEAATQSHVWVFHLLLLDQKFCSVGERHTRLGPCLCLVWRACSSRPGLDKDVPRAGLLWRAGSSGLGLDRGALGAVGGLEDCGGLAPRGPGLGRDALKAPPEGSSRVATGFIRQWFYSGPYSSGDAVASVNPPEVRYSVLPSYHLHYISKHKYMRIYESLFLLCNHL